MVFIEKEKGTIEGTCSLPEESLTGKKLVSK
jgi:hypothetical protein